MKKRYHFFIAMILTVWALAGCSSNPFYQTTSKENFVRENWVSQVNLSSNAWVQRADPWFLTGEPNSVEQYANNAPPSAAMTTSSVNVGCFDNLIINGPFQVQIIGGQTRDSVFIYGPNVATRDVSVQRFGNTLRIEQASDSKANLKNVIVRIGVRNLKSLTQMGKGAIYGRGITSDCLKITSCDCGLIMLSGQMNVQTITQLSTGTITVIGAESPVLDLIVKGDGNVNVCGHVGIRKIIHQGNGCISIIGADSPFLSILASGNGTTSVAGYVNLRKLTASDNSRVYVYCVKSNNLLVMQSNHSRVGLAGSVTNANIDLNHSARFGGQYLHIASVYVTTRDESHANIAPDIKIFAAALNKSSIYIFGSPNIVSRYTTGNGMILPVWNDSPPPPQLSGGNCCVVPSIPTLMPQKIYKN